jgi:hypothetical protein
MRGECRFCGDGYRRPASPNGCAAEDSLTRYTARQLELFYKEGERMDNERQAAAIIAANLGMAGGKEATKAVKNLVV